MTARKIIAKAIVCLFLLTMASGCSTPSPPPEVKLAEKQEHDLWRSGADVYAPADYGRYRLLLRHAKDELIKEKTRFVWFQDYRLVQSEFRAVLQKGYVLQKKILAQKEMLKKNVSAQMAVVKSQIENLKVRTETINEGRLARRDLVRAELLLAEAENNYERGEFGAAAEKTNKISEYIKDAEDTIQPILVRFNDADNLRTWQRMAEETISASKTGGIPAIIVNKSKRELVLYNNGAPSRVYNVGLGRNGSSDKLHAGDNSTPEGKYRIIKIIHKSRYHRALLINYPNEEDRARFREAKKKGRLPAQARIGGLIEIHGGGRDSMTYGCIALDNSAIDVLFNSVPLGTPVTIVGAVGRNADPPSDRGLQ